MSLPKEIHYKQQPYSLWKSLHEHTSSFPIQYLLFTKKALSSDEEKTLKRQSSTRYSYYVSRICIYYANYKQVSRILKQHISLFTKDKLAYQQQIPPPQSQPQSQPQSRPQSRPILTQEIKHYSSGIHRGIYEQFLESWRQRWKKTQSTHSNQSRTYQPHSFRHSPDEGTAYEHQEYQQQLQRYKKWMKKQRKYFHKLYKRISLQTHPDRTQNKFYHYLYMKAQRAYYHQKFYLLLLISEIINIPVKKLHWKDQMVLNDEIELLIQKRVSMIQHPLFRYSSYSESQKKNLIQNNLSSQYK